MLAGVALLLGGMLMAAGLPKAVAPWHVARALGRVIRHGPDRRLRSTGRLLGLWELSLGALLVLAGGRGPAAVTVAALAALTYGVFVAFVVLAIRRGAACGCWASLSDGPAGGAELGRAVFLAGLAVALLAGQLSAVPAPAPGRSSLAWAVALLAATWLAARLGAVLLPVRAPRLRRRLQMQAAPGRLGRLGDALALLGGFVHAGTTAGRGRYLAASPTAAQPIRRSRTPLPPRPPAGAGAATPLAQCDIPLLLLAECHIALEPPVRGARAASGVLVAATEGRTR